MSKRAIAATAAICVLCALGFAWSGSTEPVCQGRILPPGFPPGWEKLDLSTAQLEKIDEVQTKTNKVVADLHEKIKTVRAKERTELLGLLTEPQRLKLEELIFKGPAKTNPNEKGRD